jgi:hypothetical protein
VNVQYLRAYYAHIVCMACTCLILITTIIIAGEESHTRCASLARVSGLYVPWNNPYPDASLYLSLPSFVEDLFLTKVQPLWLPIFGGVSPIMGMFPFPLYFFFAFLSAASSLRTTLAPLCHIVASSAVSCPLCV